MKHTIILLLLVFGSITDASCDNFQLIFYNNGVRSYIPYTTVKIYNIRGREVFKGTTDRQGRIAIKGLANANNYRMEVYYKRKTCGKNHFDQKFIRCISTTGIHFTGLSLGNFIGWV